MDFFPHKRSIADEKESPVASYLTTFKTEGLLGKEEKQKKKVDERKTMDGLKIFSDDLGKQMCDEWPESGDYYPCGDLLIYAVNHHKLAGLKRFVDLYREKGVFFSNLECFQFVTKYPDFALWKQVAEALGVNPTCVMGAYDYDTISSQFYEEMIVDLGPERVMKDAIEERHEFECCEIVNHVAYYINRVRLASARAKTGLLCPSYKALQTNIDLH
jgi:hypothetical protein